MNTNNVKAHRESQVATTSGLFAFMDARGISQEIFGRGGPTVQFAGLDYIGAFKPQVEKMEASGGLQMPPQHGSYFNVLSCDSHVAPVRLSDLFPPANLLTGAETDWPLASSWNIDRQPHPEVWADFAP